MPRDNDRRSGRGRGGRRGRGGGGGGGGGQRRNFPDKPTADMSENPTVIQFGEFSKMLDDRHDRHERLVKLSRDITIESKRIIFALHRIRSEDDKPAVLGEAETRLGSVRKNLWRSVALELRGQDAFQYLRAYTAGLQEYIEAFSFYHYLCYDTLVTWETVQKELTFEFVIGGKKQKEGNIEQDETKA